MTAQPVTPGVDPALEAHWDRVFVERRDLFDRLHAGDVTALTELFHECSPVRAGLVSGRDE